MAPGHQVSGEHYEITFIGARCQVTSLKCSTQIKVNTVDGVVVKWLDGIATRFHAYSMPTMKLDDHEF